MKHEKICDPHPRDGPGPAKLKDCKTKIPESIFSGVLSIGNCIKVGWLTAEVENLPMMKLNMVD
jgi:hypothetical protein